MANRRAAGTTVVDSRRTHVANAAVSDQTTTIRSAGLDRRKPDRLHTGAASAGAGDREAVRDGPVVHTTITSGHRSERHEGYDPVARLCWRRGLAGRGI